MNSQPCIFISYRHDDSGGYAQSIYDRLVKRYGKEVVFRDLEGILPGKDFTQVLREKGGTSNAMVAIIGRQWLTITGKDGKPRLSNPTDWVRAEVAGAIQHGAVVIPVLVGGAAMPQPGDLIDCDDLKPFSNCNAVTIHDELFDRSMDRLIVALDAALAGVERRRLGARLSQLKTRRWALAAGALALLGISGVALMRLLQQDATPVEARLYASKTIPASLFHSVSMDLADGVSWFRVNGNNHSRSPRNITVSFTVNGGSVESGGPFDDIRTFPPGPFSADFNPRFKLTTYVNPEGRLEIGSSVSVSDGNGMIHSSPEKKPFYIKILPRNMFEWNLQTPDGKPVSKKLLLASLAAWIISKSPLVQAEANKLWKPMAQVDDEDTLATKLIGSFYAAHFRKDLKILHGEHAFPPSDPQRYGTPEELLSPGPPKRTDPVEAALVLGAVTHAKQDLRIKKALIFLTDEDARNGIKTTLFAWSVNDGGVWRGVDLSHSFKLDFADNERGTSKLLNNVLVNNPQIVRDMLETGVHFDDASKPIAIEFIKASQTFGIQPLP